MPGGKQITYFCLMKNIFIYGDKMLQYYTSTTKQSINHNCIKVFQIRNTRNVNISSYCWKTF